MCVYYVTWSGNEEALKGIKQGIDMTRLTFQKDYP